MCLWYILVNDCVVDDLQDPLSRLNPSPVTWTEPPAPDPVFKVPGLPVRRTRKNVATFVKPKTVEELRREREKEKEESRKKAAAVLSAEKTSSAPRGRGGGGGATRGRGRGRGLAAKRNRIEDREPEYEPNLSEGSSSDED
jgi:hypothetical protein